MTVRGDALHPGHPLAQDADRSDYAEDGDGVQDQSGGGHRNPRDRVVDVTRPRPLTSRTAQSTAAAVSSIVASTVVIGSPATAYL